MPQKRKSNFRKSLKKSKRSHRNCADKNPGQKGGMEKGDMMMNSKMEMPMMPPETMKKPLAQKGGSPASSLVMASYDSPPVMNDYVADPRIPDSNLNGSDIGGCKFGGGTASDMVMSQLTDVVETVNYPEGQYKPAGNINSLNLYAPSGGAKKNKRSKNKKRSNKKRSNKRNNKSRRNKKNNNNYNNNNNNNNNYNNNVMRGGHASDWISSQYSLGSINGNSMNDNTTDFSNSQGVSRDVLMNPPTLGLAGSGYSMGDLEGANVRSTGAPLV